MSDAQRGRFVWFDLMTTDVAAAQKFYRAVVGWTVTPYDAFEEPYDMWIAGEQPIGGAMELPDEAVAAGAPPHWLGYAQVSDVDATVSRATALGGAVLMEPADIPTVGRFAVIQDPFGAVIAPFAPDEPGPVAERPGAGEVSWRELMSDDHDKAFAFYHELFGWEKSDAVDMGDAGIYQLVKMAGDEADGIGMMRRPDEVPISYWLYYFNTDDLDAAVERVGANGGQVIMPPVVVPGGDRISVCMDPQGGAFALHEYTDGETADA